MCHYKLAQWKYHSIDIDITINKKTQLKLNGNDWFFFHSFQSWSRSTVFMWYRNDIVLWIRLLVTTEIGFFPLSPFVIFPEVENATSFWLKINKSQISYFHFPIAANGRAPLEPYYGRYIGNFTEFAHKIKVHFWIIVLNFFFF